MVKRVLFGLALVACAGGSSVRAATCAAAGTYFHAGATFADEAGRSVTIYGESFGNFATGPVAACSSGSGGLESQARPLMRITVDGIEKCRRTDASSRLTSDPVAHAGGGVHNLSPDPEGHPVPDGSCGADVSWDNLVATPTVWPGQTATLDGSGVQGSFCKSAGFTGRYWLDGSEPMQVPADSTFAPLPIVGRAYFCEGAKAGVDSVGL